MGRTKRFPLFYKILFAALGVFAVLVAIALFWLHGFLADYEAAQPEHVAEKVVEEYFKNGDMEKLLADSTYEVPKYSSTEDVVSYLGDAIDKNDVSFYSVSSGSADGKVTYAIKSREFKVAVINLREKADPGRFKGYELDSIDLTIGGSNAVMVKAPKGYNVMVNGVTLGEELLHGDEEPTDSCGHVAEGLGIVFVTYKLEGLFGEPDISVTSSDGTAVGGITANEEGTYYAVSPAYAEVTDELKANVLAAGESYAAYMQHDAAFTRIARYVDRSSDLYENLRTSQTMWVNDHNGYSIENASVTELYYYDSDTYSCRVKFDHVLHMNGSNDYVDAFDMTLYYRKVGNTFLIYDSQRN